MTEFIKSDIPANSIIFNAPDEVLRIGPDGRIYWRQREVDTDDDLRAAMLDLVKILKEVK